MVGNAERQQYVSIGSLVAGDVLVGKASWQVIIVLNSEPAALRDFTLCRFLSVNSLHSWTTTLPSDDVLWGLLPPVNR